jgi:hypothetical protein
MWFNLYSLPLFATLLIVFSGLAWKGWGSQSELFPRPRARTVIGFLALSLATASTALWAAYLLFAWITGAFARLDNVSASLGVLLAVGGLI